MTQELLKLSKTSAKFDNSGLHPFILKEMQRILKKNGEEKP